ncbi:MAG: hypothetical protein KJZ65_03020 [Phycisphaerales bacterium]|nr:hypothetical protein [Phycisphaerales bacterium]
METEPTRVRNHIRAPRLEHGPFARQQPALHAGVSRQAPNAIEGGGYSPSLDVARHIARVFGKPVDEVLADVEG